MKRLFLLLFSLMLVLSAAADSKKVRDLKSKQAKLQKELNENKKNLEKTRKDVQKGQKQVKYLDTEIEARVRYIHTVEAEIDTLESRITRVQSEVNHLDSVLNLKKDKYIRSLRMAQTYRQVHSTLLYALSASDVTQMYRRLRYTREYAAYQRALGEEVLAKQIALLEKQNQLLSLKSDMNQKMAMLISERAKLSRQLVQQKEVVSGLQKKQSGLQKQVEEKQKQIAALQKKIDEVVAYEIEQARKKAEAERRKREAEAAKKNGGKAPATTPSKDTAKGKTTSGSSSSKWLTPEERQLNGSLEQNKGRLPVPITGQYMIGAHYGANTSGMKNVVLDNKGTNYVGKAGARARSIFDGEVSAVFSFGGMKNVLVRHGSYISVYCNLSSVIVKKGQKVKARDLLGTVADDGSGSYTLHFQLRKETTRLNPEVWIGR